MIGENNDCVPAVLCRCWCECDEAVAYIGLGQMEPEDKGDSSLICENCLDGAHFQDRLDASIKHHEDELREEEKKRQDEEIKKLLQDVASKNEKDNPRTILNRRLASGDITVDEYDRIKERLDSE